MVKLDELLNDGLLFYGETKTKRDALKKVIATEFISSGRLFFNYAGINQRFDEWTVGNLSEVTLKVKTYFDRGIHKSHKVSIDGVLYEILAMDPTNDRKYIFLFLKKVGVLGVNNSVK